jgi:acyl-CoA hydrolase
MTIRRFPQDITQAGRMTDPLTDLDAAARLILDRLPGELRVGAPLGIGKPHRLINALYARVTADASRPMQLYTALSLNPPSPGDGLQARFAKPFLARHFGEDFPRLAYVDAMLGDALPEHVQVEEFYMQSGALLHSRQAQSAYTSLNYTMAADAIAARVPNLIVQKVAAQPGSTRLSLSCNTDITQDLLDAIRVRGLPRPMLVAEVDPALPWIGGSATVEQDFFDLVIVPPGPHPQLFGLPRQPVGDVDYAIGLYASTLVRDGGTLQIGIGALADALSHALVLRHTDNATYRRVLRALAPDIEQHPAVLESGGLGPFEIGLYGCSEMLNEGFKRLVETGVIRRKVHDDPELMQRLAEDSATPEDQARLAAEGEYLHGAFYLGSPDFYRWLRDLDDTTRNAIGMRRISEINQLYGGHESLERLQRHDARFFNTCMMATALGAAVSDGLEDGRVVSGVGGQYNFVAMAHALADARSVLMFRAVRDSGAHSQSNVRWNYGHTTIPRHLRDIYLNEYGIADLRGRTDEDCVIAMTSICDARFQSGLLEQARTGRKLRWDVHVPEQWHRNTPERLAATLAPFRADGTLPDYPLGSDFTPVEQELLRALGWLKRETSTPAGKLRTIVRALAPATARAGDRAALQRMGLEHPQGLAARLEARLLRFALRHAVQR